MWPAAGATPDVTSVARLIAIDCTSITSVASIASVTPVTSVASVAQLIAVTSVTSDSHALGDGRRRKQLLQVP